MKYFFDIGANNGDQWFDILNQDQDNNFVYMFEPTPQLCEVIKTKYKNLKNWILIEKAVSDFNGKTTFNIAGSADWGCSSLFEFSEDLAQTWPDKSRLEPNGDFHFTDTIEVDVITLNSFLKDNPQIDKIDYLHVDAQGSDLNILKGSSDHLNKIQKGSIEASGIAKLYKGSVTKNECIEWLKLNGFKIDFFIGDEINGDEIDIVFSKI
jgi:FkbM family methyltransferase